MFKSMTIPKTNKKDIRDRFDVIDIDCYDLEKFFKQNGCKPKEAKIWSEAYKQWLKRYDIVTPARLAGFFANVFIECSYFTRLEESLYYTAGRAAQVWPSRYADSNGKPNKLAFTVARNPQALANHTYANRMGNGPCETGDGWRYRGRGPIQLTGKRNYEECSKAINVDLVHHPELIEDPTYGSLVSCWYWDKAKGNRFADQLDFDGCRDVVNIGRKTAKVGDAHGYPKTYKTYQQMRKYLETF